MKLETKQYVRLLSDFRNDKLIGEKSKGLKYLMNNGYLIPLTFVCSSEAYEKYLENDAFLTEILEVELRSKIDEDSYYSVRSSATLEDSPKHSFAGQFKTYLNVKGISQIIEAIKNVWESTNSNRISSYSKRFLIDVKKLKMAVIIQQMVKAKISGVSFTKNPFNGRDEVAIEAINGLGDVLVQNGVNPFRAVYKWGEWIEKSDIHGVHSKLLEEIAKKSKVLEKKRGTPINLEWAYDGESLYWLQIRDITTLSGLDFYSNTMSKEFLPGMIKPLVWSVNIPVVCGAWVKLFSELAIDLEIRPQDLAKQFYFRAYFNMGVIGDVFDAFGMPREGLEVLMGYGANAPDKPSLKPGSKCIKHFPNLVQFVIDKVLFERKMKKFVKNNDQEIRKICAENLSTMDISETFSVIERLFIYNKKAAYFVIVSQLLYSVYNRIFSKLLEKKTMEIGDFNMEIDNYGDINPNLMIYGIHKKYKQLSKKDRESFKSFLLNQKDDTENSELEKVKNEFKYFLEKFGHLSDQGNDFSLATWKEQPLLLLNMVINCDNVSSIQKTEKNKEYGVVPGFLPNLIYEKVKASLEYKERISFNYTKSYGLFRKYFLNLSKLFVNAGFYDNLEDIFYLTLYEIKKIISDDKFSAELHSKVIERKQQMLDYKDIELPDVIYGDQPPVPIRKGFNLKKLCGIPASKGYYTGKSCVVKGVQDFSKVKTGDVVIIPFSDISWAPIFLKAGAVISESGGILSHSSIITREYKIPCIVGVQGACDLADGLKIHVDGFSGRITIE